VKKLEVYATKYNHRCEKTEHSISDALVIRIGNIFDDEMAQLRDEVSDLITVVSVLCEALAISGTLSKSDLESILDSRFEVCNAAE